MNRPNLNIRAFSLIFILVLCYSCPTYSQQSEVQGKGKIVLEPFPYGAVQLTGGPLRRQLDEVKSYYLAIPNDDLLKGFRKRMNFPTWGAKDLGGWYTADIFNVFGQIVGGLSRLYAVTGDEACRNKVNALIEGWAQCIDSTGYFFFSPSAGAAHYVYEKMVGGLLDAYQYAHNKEALSYLSRITDWSIKNLSRNRQHTMEWYTLTENLYRAYLITHDKKYLDFGNEWEYHTYWGALRDHKDVLKPGTNYIENVHAYSHLNTLSGAAQAYLVKGTEGYKATIINGYDFFINEQCFATGGFGITEFLTSKAEQINALRGNHKSFETQCGSWAAFKLCKYLLMITGNAKYGDWVEKLMINGIGASIPMSPDGKVFYYSDYNTREGMKENIQIEWSCCTGTRPEAVAEYTDLIYFKNSSGIYVNVFTPSIVTWNGVTLTQSTRFPESDEVLFDITTSAPKAFAIQFRKPFWLKQKPRIFVNGRNAEVTLCNDWYTIKRKWKDGDNIKLLLPMEFDVARVDTTKEYPVAIAYGPVVMALRSGGGSYPADLLTSPHSLNEFVPVPGAVLNYHVESHPDLLIRPYYEFREKEPYILYIDPLVKNQIPSSHITTTGNWQGLAQFYNISPTYSSLTVTTGKWRSQGKFSSNAGDSVTAVFTGDAIKFKATKFNDAGIGQLKIDGKVIDTIDEYSAQDGLLFERTYKTLGPGKHSITLTVLPDKNGASKGNHVNFGSFETLD